MMRNACRQRCTCAPHMAADNGNACSSTSAGPCPASRHEMATPSRSSQCVTGTVADVMLMPMVDQILGNLRQNGYTQLYQPVRGGASSGCSRVREIEESGEVCRPNWRSDLCI